MRVLALMVFDAMARHNFISIHGKNASISWLWSMNSTTNTFKWRYYSRLFQSASLVMHALYWCHTICMCTTLSFMKGLMAGATYCSLLISTLVLSVPSIPFLDHFQIWSSMTISCEFWNTTLLLIVHMHFLILVILKMCYKKKGMKMCSQMNISLSRDTIQQTTERTFKLIHYILLQHTTLLTAL